VADRTGWIARASRHEPHLLLALTLALLAITVLHPYDRLTWLLEVSPVLLAIPILVATYTRFRLTPLLYRLIFLHAVILIIGGYYTYSLTPVGFWMQRAFGFARNHYDRIGHLAQGFIPAIVAREVLLRRSPLVPGKWLFFLVTCVCVAVAALYELIEWGTAVMAGEGATAFLGTQGDPWDAQWDMFLALVGAIAAQLMLGRLHDRQVHRLSRGRPN
jgi:putative membrane protein